MFDFEVLKDKVDGETLSALTGYVGELEGKLKSLRKKADSETEKAVLLTNAQREFLDRMNVSSFEEIDAKFDPAASSDVAKQFEAKLKRAEREREEAIKARDGLSAEVLNARRSREISKALQSGGFHDVESAELLLSRSVELQGDEFVFKTSKGDVIGLAEGAKLIALDKPHLLKAPQGTGSGFRDAGGLSVKAMPQAAFDALRPAERAKAMADGFRIVD